MYHFDFPVLDQYGEPHATAKAYVRDLIGQTAGLLHVDAKAYYHLMTGMWQIYRCDTLGQEQPFSGEHECAEDAWLDAMGRLVDQYNCLAETRTSIQADIDEAACDDEYLEIRQAQLKILENFASTA